MRLDHLFTSLDSTRVCGQIAIALQNIQSAKKQFFHNRMLWDDSIVAPLQALRSDRHTKLVRRSWFRQRGRKSQTPSFPVAIGAGSHPFPFRTRKLSLLPPMVLPAQVGGRVGRCRGLITRPEWSIHSGFFFVRPTAHDRAHSRREHPLLSKNASI